VKTKSSPPQDLAKAHESVNCPYYDTKVGDRGNLASGDSGSVLHWQRHCPQIRIFFILDEATNA